MRHRKVMGFIVATAMSLLLVACGSDEKKVVDIGITPGTKTITMGQQTTFAVATTNTDYSLSTDKAAAGCVKTNATTVTCTPTASGEYDVTVTATADKNKTKTATLIVNPVIITITPETATVDIKQSVPFTVDADFTLSADDAAGCVKTNATTVTCTPTVAGTYEITVTATADPSKPVKANLKVNEINFTFDAKPPATIDLGKVAIFELSTLFTYTVNDADKAKCVQDGNKLTCTPIVAQEYTVVFTSTVDTTKTATEKFTVIVPTSITGIPDLGGVEGLDGLVMLLVEKPESGTFKMGCTRDNEADGKKWSSFNCVNASREEHDMPLTEDFYIGKYEVTQGEWKAVMSGANPSPAEQQTDDRRPVSNVTYEDVHSFIDKLNDSDGPYVQPGYKWALPTEAQWEYAARGGAKPTNCPETYGCIQSGSNTGADVAWSGEALLTGNTHPVGTVVGAEGSHAYNELGIYDMSGNVLEMVEDNYSSVSNTRGYGNAGVHANTSPVYNDSGAYVVRGGYYLSSQVEITVVHRASNKGSRDYLGFRLALVPAPPDTDEDENYELH